MVADLLYQWPSAARVNIRISKEKLYEHGQAPTAVREKFVSEVQRITWGYKLAEATINLPGSGAVPEIQVFEIDAKADDVSELILMTIDNAIPFPIIFEVYREYATGRQVRMVAAHKQLGAGAPKLSSYYSTSWLNNKAVRRPLPTAISLHSLYSGLIAPLIPVKTRPGEDAAEIGARLRAVQKLEREVAALERKMCNEPQFNRKVELHRALKAKQEELERAR